MKETFMNKIIYIIVGIVIGVLLMVILMPKRIAKLSDGSDEVVSVSNRSYSADEYYELLKKEDRLSVLLRKIDVDIIKSIYGINEEEEQKYADERYEAFLAQSELYGLDEQAALNQYGYTNKKEFITYLKDDYYLNKYYQEKLAEQYSEDDYKDYYNYAYFLDRHVVVFSSQDNNKDLNNIIKDIKKGTKISTIFNKYNTVAYNEIDVTFTDTSYGEDFLSVVKGVKEGGVSDINTNEIFGNYIVYVSLYGEDKKYEDVRDQIVNYFMDLTEQNDPYAMYRIMIDLQKEYNISFKDAELKEVYNKYVKDHTVQLRDNNTYDEIEY